MSIVEKVISLRKPKPRHPVLSSIKKRFSPRIFSSEKISDATMDILFEAARFAPSARNYQPWYFYWARTGSPAFKKLLACLPEGNQWAASANILIVACYDPVDRYSEDGKNKWVLDLL